MKIAKTLILAVVASSALFLTSCNKETECICTTTSTDADGTVLSEEETTFTSENGDCSEFEETVELLGITTTISCN